MNNFIVASIRPVENGYIVHARDDSKGASPRVFVFETLIAYNLWITENLCLPGTVVNFIESLKCDENDIPF